jgi:hypothetical protein
VIDEARAERIYAEVRALGRLLCDARLTVSDSGDLGDGAHPGTLRQVVASLVVIEDNGAPRSAIVSD